MKKPRTDEGSCVISDILRAGKPNSGTVTTHLVTLLDDRRGIYICFVSDVIIMWVPLWACYTTQQHAQEQSQKKRQRTRADSSWQSRVGRPCDSAMTRVSEDRPDGGRPMSAGAWRRQERSRRQRRKTRTRVRIGSSAVLDPTEVQPECNQYS